MAAFSSSKSVVTAMFGGSSSCADRWQIVAMARQETFFQGRRGSVCTRPLFSETRGARWSFLIALYPHETTAAED